MAVLNYRTHDYTPESLDARPSTELVDSALLRLQIRRGSYCFDPSMGSRLHLLQRSKDLPRLKKTAEQYAVEALSPLQRANRITALRVQATAAGDGRLVLHIELDTPDNQTTSFDHFVQVGG